MVARAKQTSLGQVITQYQWLTDYPYCQFSGGLALQARLRPVSFVVAGGLHPRSAGANQLTDRKH
jgi:hypothetical protein